MVLWAAGPAATPRLQRLRAEGWDWVCQLPPPRRGAAVASRAPAPGWARAKARQEVEAVSRILTSPLCLAAWPGGDRRPGVSRFRPQAGAQEHPGALGRVASRSVARERLDPGGPWRPCKRPRILTDTQAWLSALERVREAA